VQERKPAYNMCYGRKIGAERKFFKVGSTTGGGEDVFRWSFPFSGSRVSPSAAAVSPSREEFFSISLGLCVMLRGSASHRVGREKGI